MIRRPGGHTLQEMIVVFGIFSTILAITALLFRESQATFRRTNSQDTAMRELRKARAAIVRDLVVGRPGQVQRAQVPDSLGGGGKDGEALWFLSPVDPATGEMVHKQDGSPFWQRNILYYLVVPNNHDATFGMSCLGGAAANGYDDRCPHKVLIRKVIDSGAATIPTDETTEETLLANVAPYLTRPLGFSLAAMAEPGLTEREISAAWLLGFESSTAPPPSNIPREIFIDLRALSIEEARREIQVGAAPCFVSRFTRTAPFSVYLRN